MSGAMPAIADRSSPLNLSARFLAERASSLAAAIWEYRKEELRCFPVGTHGWEEGPGMRRLDFSTDKKDRLIEDGLWEGASAFVAATGQPLIFVTKGEELVASFENKSIRVRRASKFSEIRDPGPLLVVPLTIPDTNEVVGVARLLRRAGGPVFAKPMIGELKSYLDLVALTPLEARTRTRIIDSLLAVGSADDDTVLDRLVQKVRVLLRADVTESAVYLHRRRPDELYWTAGPRPKNEAHMTYAAGSPGLTSHVWRLATGTCRECGDQSQDFLLSNDLRSDTAPRGPLAHVGHEPKDAETGMSATKSWLGVAILDPKDGFKGVIRVSSERMYAFTYPDVETLRSLARQVAIVLRERARARERDLLHRTTIETSSQSIVVVDEDYRVVEWNGATARLLGIGGRQETDPGAENLEDFLFAGCKEYAAHLREAIDAARNDAGVLRDHFTVVFRRQPERIPVAVVVRAGLIRDRQNQESGFVLILRRIHPESEDIQHITEIAGGGITVHPITAETLRQVELAAATARQMLVSGETGTGKELLVKALHRASGRGSEPFLILNSAGMEASVLESELFGAEPDVFTGGPSKEARKGLFESADRGTVFLDEIEAAPPESQAKLLRFLDSREIRRVGGKPKTVDVLVVAATNEDVDVLIKQGRLRRDLIYRLDARTFRLLPLRDRRVDIPLLAEHYLEQQAARARKRGEQAPRGFDSRAWRAILAYGWPGNIRELVNAVDSAVGRWRFDKQRGIARSPLVEIEDLKEGIQAAVLNPSAESGILPLNPVDELQGQLRRRKERVEQLERQLSAANERVRPKNKQEAVAHVITEELIAKFDSGGTARREAEDEINRRLAVFGVSARGSTLRDAIEKLRAPGAAHLPPLSAIKGGPSRSRKREPRR